MHAAPDPPTSCSGFLDTARGPDSLGTSLEGGRDISFSTDHDLLPDVHRGLVEGERGRILLLNGTSSSGKSTLAAALLEAFSEPWSLMAVDDFHRRRARKPMSDAAFAPIFQRTVLGFHRAVAGLASAGNDVVVDHILGESWRLRDCAAVFDGYPAYLVGVHCAANELNRRERARGDRQIGRAAFQLGLVHAHQIYDIEVDTSRADPHALAAKIVEHVEREPPKAFAAVRASAS